MTIQGESKKNLLQLEEKMMEVEKEWQKENQQFILHMMAIMCQAPPCQVPPVSTHRYDSIPIVHFHKMIIEVKLTLIIKVFSKCITHLSW